MGRPVFRFEGIVGQAKLVKSLLQMLRGVIARGRALAVLLYGSAGGGKTTIASVIARHAGGTLRKLIASRDLTPAVLAGVLRQVRAGDVLFIDELHAAPVATQELLFGFLDSGEVPRLGDNGRLDPSERERVARAHFIAATTEPGALINPLISRLECLSLARYTTAELRAIVDDVACAEALSLTPQAAGLLAERCQGSPREARKLVVGLGDWQADRQVFTREDVDRYFRSRGISRHGLTPAQQQYLTLLHEARNGRSTLERIVTLLGLDQAFVRRNIEPFLLALRAIDIDRERVLTERGKEIVHELAGEDDDA